MLYFNCDYNNGCHPEVLKHLVETNDTFTDSYNYDCYTMSAVEKIKEATGWATKKEDVEKLANIL